MYQWEKKRKIDTIRTPGGKRLYNVNKFLHRSKFSEKKLDDSEDNEIDELDDSDEKLNIIYARVSSLSQKDDLQNQILELKNAYPKYKLIKDIGSGVNLNRKGLRKIIELAIAGKVNKLVIAHKDRLTRFGYELIEDLIKDYSEGKIIVLNENDTLEPEEELVKDVLTIMNVFVARMNGLRKYKKKNNF